MLDAGKLHKDAQKLLRGGQAQKALAVWLELLAQIDAPQSTYDTWIADAERAAARLPDPRLAAYLALYRRDAAAAAALLPRDRYPDELAHALALDETRDTERLEAAALFESQQRLVSAARVYSTLGSLTSAVRCYRQLLTNEKLGPYEQALVHFQLAVALHRQNREDPDRRRHAALCQGLLETLADEYEAAGDLERALDCYRLYVRLGQTLGSCENIVEGYVSCLRLLKDERRTLDVLRHYEELLRSCDDFAEHHLYAEKSREAAAYLDRDHPDWARIYRRRAAEALSRAFTHNKQRGGPPQLGESTLLQAAAAYNAVDDFVAVGGTFSALADLCGSSPAIGHEARARRYREVAARYPQTVAAASQDADLDEAEPPPNALPSYVREQPALPPVWDLDLIEWQAAGDPSAVCLALVGDRSRPQLTRRHALTVLLSGGLAALETPGSLDRQRRVIEGLCGLRCYEALRPLERLWSEASGPPKSGQLGAAKVDRSAAHSLANPTPEVHIRRAIIQALPRLPFRRTLQLIECGLRDPDLGVYTASVEALASAYFPEAVSGLIRLYRTVGQASLSLLEVQQNILRALAHSRDPRAREHLADVARHDIEPLSRTAAGLLQILTLSDVTRPG